MNKREEILLIMGDYERLRKLALGNVESLINLYPSFDYSRFKCQGGYDPTINAILIRESILEERKMDIKVARKLIKVINGGKGYIPRRAWKLLEERFLLGEVRSRVDFNIEVLKKYEEFFLIYVANRVSKEFLETYIRERKYEYK